MSSSAPVAMPLPSLFRRLSFLTLGMTQFTRSGFLAAQKSFLPSDDFLTSQPSLDLMGRTILVTGGNSGIGLETARALLNRGAEVHVICRDQLKGEVVRSRLLQEAQDVWNKYKEKENSLTPRCFFHYLDLSNISSIKSFASAWLQSCLPLSGLIANAGAMKTQRQTTQEGLEENFALNVLGTYVLCERFIPILRSSLSVSSSLPPFRPKLLVVSSHGMLTQDLFIKDLQSETGTFDGTYVYAQNKRAQVALVEKWAREEKQAGGEFNSILFASCAPGWASTPGLENSMPDFHKKLEGKLRSSAEGADTIVWLTASKSANNPQKPLVNGEFWSDRQIFRKHLWGAWSQYKEESVDELANILKQMESKIQENPQQVEMFRQQLEKTKQ
jgi:dehydrogenase/reductase SDR family protein 12